MGAYRLPRRACQPCSLIDGCFAINLCHNLLWTGLAVPISSKGGALDIPHLAVRIGHGRAGIPAVAGVFELTVLRYSQQLSRAQGGGRRWSAHKKDVRKAEANLGSAG